MLIRPGSLTSAVSSLLSAVPRHPGARVVAGAAVVVALAAGVAIAATGDESASTLRKVAGQPPGAGRSAPGSAQAGPGGPAGTSGGAASLPGVGSGPGSGPSAGSATAWDAADGRAIPASAQQPLPATVALITGDAVRVEGAEGAQHATVAVPKGTRPSSQDFVQFQWAGDLYVVPDEAVPYLGAAVDARLFDVSYLARAKLGTVSKAAPQGAPIPVTVRYTGAAPPQLPAVRISKASAGTATGTVDPADGAQLAQLLARDWHRGRGGLPGTERLSLAPPSGAPALPASPLRASGGSLPANTTPTTATGGVGPSTTRTGLHHHRLTVNLTGPDGQPANLAMGLVQNVDDLRLDAFLDMPVYDSSVTYSLPEGTYSVAFTVLTPHPGTLLGYDVALLVQPQVSVTADSTVKLDARKAVPFSAPLVGAPTPPARIDVLDYTRSSLTGGTVSGLAASYLWAISLSGHGITATNMSATPTDPVTKGAVAFNAASKLDDYWGPAGPDPTYTFSFPSQGRIPSALSYPVHASDLTTLHNRIYGNGNNGTCSAADAATSNLSFSLVQAWMPDHVPPGFGSFDMPTPGRRTDYIYDSDPRLESWQAAISNCNLLMSSTPVPDRHGQQVTLDWGKAPLVPSPIAPLTSLQVTSVRYPDTVCPACRQGDIAELTIADVGDADGHYYLNHNFLVDQPHYYSGLEFYRNGSLAVTSDALCSEHIYPPPVHPGSCGIAPNALALPMLHDPATYRLDWHLTHVSNGGPAKVDTSWTFHSGPGDAVTRVPAPEHCAPDPTAGCSLLPLLFLGYDLPLDINSQAAAGKPLTVSFTAGYQQNQPPPSGVTASVSASFDDGATWSAPVPATPAGDGKFAVTINQPQLADTSGFASLRVTARDSAGNSVTQTIIKAYGLTS